LWVLPLADAKMMLMKFYAVKEFHMDGSAAVSRSGLEGVIRIMVV